MSIADPKSPASEPIAPRPLRFSTKEAGDATGWISPPLERGLLLTDLPLPLAEGASVTLALINSQNGKRVPIDCVVEGHDEAANGEVMRSRIRIGEVNVALRPVLVELEEALIGGAAARRVPAAQSTVGDGDPPVRDDWAETLGVLEKSGRHREAFDHARRVLNSPQQGMNIDLHLRVAQLALKVEDLKLAYWHVDFVSRLEPTNPGVAEMRLRITDRANAKAAVRREKTRREGTTFVIASRRRLYGLLVSIALLVIVVVVNVKRFVLVDEGETVKLDLGAVSRVLPATRAELYADRLYVTVEPAWRQQDVKQRTTALEELGRFGRSFDANEVIVVGPGPEIYGRLAPGGKINLR